MGIARQMVRTKARTKVKKKPERYHHGDLQGALIAATDAILAETGMEGFTLREAARRAGVSPAAPAHHFGNATGLLTDVAIKGFEELTRRLRQARLEPVQDNAPRLHALGMAYVCFALDYPGRFHLMFANNRLKEKDERLARAALQAHDELRLAAKEYLAGRDYGDPTDTEIARTMSSAWSLAHGFAHLALAGKMIHMTGKKNVEQLVREELPAVLADLFPPRH
jgi:AcrR family transcriptional regulator